MSRVKRTEGGSDALPALSIAWDATVCRPSAEWFSGRGVENVKAPERATGAAAKAPASTLAFRDFRPERRSAAGAVTLGSAFVSVVAEGRVITTAGGVVSSVMATPVRPETLPALSTAWTPEGVRTVGRAVERQFGGEAEGASAPVERESNMAPGGGFPTGPGPPSRPRDRRRPARRS